MCSSPSSWSWWSSVAANLFEDKGKLAVVVQYAYAMAAPALAHLPRRQAPPAAGPGGLLPLRGHDRGRSGAAAADPRRAGTGAPRGPAGRQARMQSIVFIQKIWRGALARTRSRRLLGGEDRAPAPVLRDGDSARSGLQRRVRREGRERDQGAAQKDDYESTVNWAVISIQRYVRGHQAKRVIVNKRVELGLSDRLQRLAHRYLQNGRPLGFLRNVNADYERYEHEQQAILQREDEMAATFVDKGVRGAEQEHARGLGPRSTRRASKGGASCTAAAAGTRRRGGDEHAREPPTSLLSSVTTV